MDHEPWTQGEPLPKLPVPPKNTTNLIDTMEVVSSDDEGSEQEVPQADSLGNLVESIVEQNPDLKKADSKTGEVPSFMQVDVDMEEDWPIPVDHLKKLRESVSVEEMKEIQNQA